MFLKINDSTFLRFHKNYNILINLEIIKKLSQQYINSFKILKKINKFIYRLKVFKN